MMMARKMGRKSVENPIKYQVQPWNIFNCGHKSQRERKEEREEKNAREWREEDEEREWRGNLQREFQKPK